MHVGWNELGRTWSSRKHWVRIDGKLFYNAFNASHLCEKFKGAVMHQSVNSSMCKNIWNAKIIIFSKESNFWQVCTYKSINLHKHSRSAAKKKLYNKFWGALNPYSYAKYCPMFILNLQNFREGESDPLTIRMKWWHLWKKKQTRNEKSNFHALKWIQMI